jgi:hypothetical protein
MLKKAFTICCLFSMLFASQIELHEGLKRYISENWEQCFQNGSVIVNGVAVLTAYGLTRQTRS